MYFLPSTSDSDEGREKVLLTDIFFAPKKSVDKKKKDENSKVRKIKLIKNMFELFRQASIPTVPISSLMSGVRIEEPEVVVTQSRLFTIDPKYKGNG